MNAIRLPRVAEKIIDRLEAAGYEAYAVGGCVRDSLLGRTPEDWDITTSATPEQVKRVFQRTVDTGIAHGTVTVLMGGEDSICDGVRGYELTTYRIDGAYHDGRHPESVTFTPSLYEDLARRDFTINAMAYNPHAGLVDEFDGVADLKSGVLRAVGVAEQRFTEDALRMLRALRFSAQLGFSIEAETYEAIRKLAPNLQKVSRERIAVELGKLLMSDHPGEIARVFERGLAPYICEDFAAVGAAYAKKSAAAGDLPFGETEIDAASPDAWMPQGLAKKKHLCWGVFLRHVPGLSGQILKELKLDNDTIKKAAVLTALLQKPLPDTAHAVRRLLSEVGYELYSDWLHAVERLSAAEGFMNGAAEPAQRAALLRARMLAEEILDRGDCIGLKTLAVSGQDLMDAGVPKGPAVGRILHSMLEDVLEEPAHNDRAYLMSRYAAGTAQ